MSNMVQGEDMVPALHLVEVAVMEDTDLVLDPEDMVVVEVMDMDIIMDRQSVMVDTDPVRDPRDMADITMDHQVHQVIMDTGTITTDHQTVMEDMVPDLDLRDVVMEDMVITMDHQDIMDTEDTTMVHHVLEDTDAMDHVLILQEVMEDTDMDITTDLRAQEDMDIITAEDPDPADAMDHHAHSHRIMEDTTTITTVEDPHHQNVIIITDVITTEDVIHHIIADIITTFHHVHHLHSGHHVHHRSGHHTVVGIATIIITDIVHFPHKFLVAVLIPLCIMYIYLS